MQDVAIVGLGNMGMAMARRLQEAGHRVVAWNRSPLPAAAVDGLEVTGRLEDLSSVPVLVLIVADDAAVESVLERLEPLLGRKQTVVDMGTSDPRCSRRHAARLAERGIGWVDAPVSGGPEGAEQGSLAIMVGGHAADVEPVQPVLEALGRPVAVGGPGDGHTVKLTNQIISCLAIEAVAESMAFADRAGLDLATVQRALRGGSGDSLVFRAQGGRMAARDYRPRASVRIVLKDVRLALDVADANELALPHLRNLVDRYEQLVDAGKGDLDCAAIYELLA